MSVGIQQIRSDIIKIQFVKNTQSKTFTPKTPSNEPQPPHRLKHSLPSNFWYQFSTVSIICTMQETLSPEKPSPHSSFRWETVWLYEFLLHFQGPTHSAGRIRSLPRLLKKLVRVRAVSYRLNPYLAASEARDWGEMDTMTIFFERSSSSCGSCKDKT